MQNFIKTEANNDQSGSVDVILMALTWFPRDLIKSRKRLPDFSYLHVVLDESLRWANQVDQIPADELKGRLRLECCDWIVEGCIEWVLSSRPIGSLRFGTQWLCDSRRQGRSWWEQPQASDLMNILLWQIVDSNRCCRSQFSKKPNECHNFRSTKFLDLNWLFLM